MRANVLVYKSCVLSGSYMEVKRKRKMNIVVPKETYPSEKRVIILPHSAKVLVEAGHNVFVQAGAGSEINIPDSLYVNAGATIISDTTELYASAKHGIIVKLRAPSNEEFSFMENITLICMLHIAQNTDRIYYLGSQKLVGLALENIRNERNMRLIDQTGITGEKGVYYALQHSKKMPSDMNAVILGYGNVATGAINACSKLGINYKIMRRTELKNISLWLTDADLLVNAISWPEEQIRKQEYLITRNDIKNSNPGMVVLDLAVDFPGPIETVHPTTYRNPFYMEEGRVHISIYGYPGLVPITSSRIYSEQILPIVSIIAYNGGLNNIKNAGVLGSFIQPAIVDPSNYGDWKKYKPLTSPGSRIE